MQTATNVLEFVLFCYHPYYLLIYILVYISWNINEMNSIICFLFLLQNKLVLCLRKEVRHDMQCDTRWQVDIEIHLATGMVILGFYNTATGVGHLNKPVLLFSV